MKYPFPNILTCEYLSVTYKSQHFTSCTIVCFWIILVLLQSQLITNDYWHIPGRVKEKKKIFIKSFRQWKESHSSYCWIPLSFTTVYHEKCLLKIGLNSLLLFPRRAMSFSIIHSTQHLMCACEMAVITYSFHKLLWDLWIRITHFINHTYTYKSYIHLLCNDTWKCTEGWIFTHSKCIYRATSCTRKVSMFQSSSWVPGKEQFHPLWTLLDQILLLYIWVCVCIYI